MAAVTVIALVSLQRDNCFHTDLPQSRPGGWALDFSAFSLNPVPHCMDVTSALFWDSSELSAWTLLALKKFAQKLPRQFSRANLCLLKLPVLASITVASAPVSRADGVRSWAQTHVLLGLNAEPPPRRLDWETSLWSQVASASGKSVEEYTLLSPCWQPLPTLLGWRMYTLNMYIRFLFVRQTSVKLWRRKNKLKKKSSILYHWTIHLKC